MPNRPRRTTFIRRLAAYAFMRRTTAHAGLLLLLCLLAGAALAQSGRRATTTPRVDPPVPTPTPEATPTPRAPVEQIQVIVTVSAPTSVMLSTFDANIVGDTFLQRLRGSNGLKVETADRLSRDGARKRAKAEESRYVVWLELQPNGMDTDISGVTRPRAEELHIQYVVYEPRTGTTRTNGNVYLIPARSVPVGRNITCYPTRLDGYQSSLMIGAIETANRVFAAFALPEPPLCP
ncbi:MAG TPA: hypothetical protein VF546_10465 [Pyrinomonadaceae bacterium]|jgi:hypothetical protein